MKNTTSNCNPSLKSTSVSKHESSFACVKTENTKLKLKRESHRMEASMRISMNSLPPISIFLSSSSSVWFRLAVELRWIIPRDCCVTWDSALRICELWWMSEWTGTILQIEKMSGKFGEKLSSKKWNVRVYVWLKKCAEKNERESRFTDWKMRGNRERGFEWGIWFK